MTNEARFFTVMIKVIAFFLCISCIGLFEDPASPDGRGGSSDEETGVTGHVLDKDGKPVSGVVARLTELDSMAITDEDGYFQFIIKGNSAGLAKKAAPFWQDTLTLSYKNQIFFKEAVSAITDTLNVILGSIYTVGSFSNCPVFVTRVTASFKASEGASSLEMEADLEYTPGTNIYTGTLYYSYTSAEMKYALHISAYGEADKLLIRSEAMYFSGDSSRMTAPELKVPSLPPDSIPDTSQYNTIRISGWIYTVDTLAVQGAVVRLIRFNQGTITDSLGSFGFAIPYSKSPDTPMPNLRDTLVLSYDGKVFYRQYMELNSDALAFVMGAVDISGTISRGIGEVASVSAEIPVSSTLTNPALPEAVDTNYTINSIDLQYHQALSSYTGTLYYEALLGMTVDRCRIQVYGPGGNRIATSEWFPFFGREHIEVPGIIVRTPGPGIDTVYNDTAGVDTMYNNTLGIDTLTVDTVGIDTANAFPNSPPFAPVPPQFTAVNLPLSFTISDSGADSGDLAYSMLAPPVSNGGPTFDSSTNTFSWTPTHNDTGTFIAKFEVTDKTKPAAWDTFSVAIIVMNLDNDALVVRQLLNMNGLTSVPINDTICEYTGERITGLFIGDRQLTSLPASIQNLTELKSLMLSNNKLTSIPAEIGNLTKLQLLWAGLNELTNLPAEIGNLINLTNLDVSHNQLSSLPASMGSLTKLESLKAYENKFISLPDEIGNLINLLNLDISSNELSSLPANIGKLTKLETFAASYNKFIGLPDEIGNLISLSELYMPFNQLNSLPAGIGNLTKLRDLDIIGNKLTSLPVEIGSLVNLSSLDITGNHLSSLPSEIGNLNKLNELLAGGNKITSLPAEIGNLSNITALNIANNQLSSLPSEILNLSKLTMIQVNGNNLCNLSEAVKKWINTNSNGIDWESAQSCNP